ncbi:MAG: hypothetical protein JWO95_82 [Verrucomicrobiales bacterium]|nr:hypothetical protein [Verrucomicrobiales bacterium]
MIPRSLIINDRNSLEAVAALLHDSRFTADSILFDADKQAFSLKCWIQLSFRGAYKAYILSFANITRCNVLQAEDVRFYEIATLRINGGGRRLEIATHYAIDISLDFDSLDGMLNETDETRTW